MSTIVRTGRHADSRGGFAELLRAQRTVAGMSQRELARRSGLSERGVRNLERGITQRPRHDSVRAVAGALGLAGAELASFLAVASWDAPAVMSAGPPGPHPAGDLLGRATELRRLADLVAGERHRIITVAGPAGVGKSRLVAELVAVLRSRPRPHPEPGPGGPGEVYFVDLASVREPELVGEVIAEALGYGGYSRLRPVDRIAARWRERRALLVLDCFERLIGAAPEISALVRRCPRLTVLATSQRSLRVSGEHLVRLGGLAQPEAVELLVRRARAAAPGLALTPQGATAAARICRQVDGLPLAIELAAAKLRLLTPVELARRLERRLPVLTGDSQDVPVRHRSLRAALESSVALLTGQAATVFSWWGTFSGGGLLADIEAMAGMLGYEPARLLSAVGELVDTSLARVAEEAGASRYTLPDAIAELAAERLAADPRLAVSARRVHASHYLGQLRRWSDEPAGTARSMTGSDAGNLRAALDWALANQPALVDRPTVEALHRYFELTGRLGEGRAVFTRLARAGVPIGWVRAGHLARLQGSFEDAAELARTALATLDPEDHRGHALARLLLGSASTEQRRFDLARRHLRAALKHAARGKDTVLVGRALNNLGTLSMEMGRLRDAERLLAAALAAKRRHAAGPVDCGRTLYNLSENALDAGEFDTAAARASAAEAELRSGGFHRLAAVAASVRAMACWRTGQLGEAVTAAALAAELSREAGEDRRTTALIDMRRSVVLHAAGDFQAAAALMGEAARSGLTIAVRDWEEVAYAVEAHATLLAPSRPAAAAALLGAAGQLRVRVPRQISEATSSLIRETAGACRERLGANEFTREHERGARLDWSSLIELLAR